MIMRAIPVILCAAVVFATSCGNGAQQAKTTPKPGTLIARDEMPAAGDSLNKFKISVEVTADSDVENGVYDVTAIWGNNTASSKFTMPKGGEDLAPILRRESKPNAWIIGFRAGKDTTFNEYYEISGEKGALKMMYTKSYSFQ
jgi:hypothetical protein